MGGIESVDLQAMPQPLAVGLRGDHDAGSTGAQTCTNKITDCVQKEVVGLVELHQVL